MDNQPTLRPQLKILRMRAECVNVIGLRRDSNEDAFCANDYWLVPDQMNENVACSQQRTALTGIYGVFDGVGSDPRGEEAACAAARFFSENRELVSRKCASEMDMDDLFARANEAVRQESDGSATTAALLVLVNARAYAANVGDSSIFLFRRGLLETVGATHHPADASAESHTITRYLGEDSLVGRYHPHVARPIPLEHDDLFLICSDGVTDMLTDAKICAALSREELADCDKADLLIREAMDAGGRDNATVLLVRVALD